MRKIIHCDCDCFYAAVEMRDDPSLRGIPLAVGGRADRRGVIATCSYEARAFGVRSAMATAKALKLCPQLKVISGNMARYREVSRQIMAIYRDYTELVEPLSLDEAYLDVSASNRCQGSATRIAGEIRQRVRDEVGICVSAGVAPNRFLAKIASDWNKPDGLCVIRPDQVEAFVRVLPVEKLHGVGNKTAERLHQMGIKTCDDLRARGNEALVQRFGRFGQRLWELAWGRDERPVQVHHERKSVSVEHTYPADLEDLSSCLSHLPALIDELEGRYRRLSNPAQVCGAMVKVKFADFTQTTAEQALSGRGEAAAEALLFERLTQAAWLRGERPVRLLGVGFRLREADAEASAEQLALF